MYAYFFSALLGRQFIERTDGVGGGKYEEPDMYFPFFTALQVKKKEKKKRYLKSIPYEISFLEYRFSNISKPKVKKQTNFVFYSLLLISFSSTLNRLIEYIYIPYTYRTIFQTIFRTYNWIRPGFPLPFSVFVSVLLLRGMVESRRGVDQSFRRGR